MAMADADREQFVVEWNELDRRDRLHLRRLVRMGRPVNEPALAAIAARYARYQTSRPWMRFFWFWYIPGVIVALGAATQIHPIVTGVVLVLAVQAIFAYVNLRRAARGV